MKISTEKGHKMETVIINTIDLGNGHIGITINGNRVERQMERADGSSYFIAESYSNLKDIIVTDIDDRWTLPFINGISINGVIAIRKGVEVVNNTTIDIVYR